MVKESASKFLNRFSHRYQHLSTRALHIMFFDLFIVAIDDVRQASESFSQGLGGAKF